MRVKYPKTPHLPWSPGLKNDDTRLRDVSVFYGKEVVVTEKMDGENTTLYRDGLHARSLDSKHHISRDFVKSLHAKISYMIPEGYRMCGENMYARHSIPYDALDGYYLLFSVWDSANQSFPWIDVETWARSLDIPTVPVLYKGVWDEKAIRNKWATLQHESEGYVVRLAGSFHFNDFRDSIAKYVRHNHIQTDDHWMTKTVVPNKLKENT